MSAVVRRRVTIEQWITAALQDPDKRDAEGNQKPCSMLTLWFIKPIGKEEVHSKEISGPQNFAKLAEFFTDKACAFCQDLPGIQSFQLQAFYGSKEAQASHTFTAFEGNVTAGEQTPYSKHEPTPTGLQAQLMKHNESLVDDFRALANDYRSLSQGLVGMCMEQFTLHNKEKAEMHVILRDVLLDTAKQQQAMMMERLRFERETSERAMFAKVLPGTLNHVLGREVIPENIVDSQIIEALALKISPQQLQFLAQSGMVSQEQLTVLTQRFIKIREEHEKRALVGKTLPPEDSSNGKPS